MDKNLKISDAEWQVMKVLWENNPLTAGQIISQLNDTNWSPNTIHTLLSRLATKGALKVSKNAHLNEYTPLITATEGQQLENSSFLKKVYDGSLKMMFAGFIKEEQLSSDDLEYLKKLISEKEK